MQRLVPYSRVNREFSVLPIEHQTLDCVSYAGLVVRLGTETRTELVHQTGTEVIPMGHREDGPPGGEVLIDLARRARLLGRLVEEERRCACHLGDRPFVIDIARDGNRQRIQLGAAEIRVTDDPLARSCWGQLSPADEVSDRASNTGAACACRRKRKRVSRKTFAASRRVGHRLQCHIFGSLRCE